MREIEIRPLGPSEAARWNDFVVAHPEGTFFHLAGWKTVLERAFGHPTHYLVAAERSSGAISGVLPLGRLRHWLLGDALVSTPFCVYGGVLAADDASEAALTEEACSLAERLGVDYLELRNRRRRRPGWPCKDLYATFRKEIAPDAETNLKNIPRKQRRMVRLGIDAGLVGELDPQNDRFFPLFAESVRNLGTPVFPRRYFDVLRDVFADACEVLTVTRAGTALGSVMSFYFRDEVLPYYGGGGTGGRAFAANDFMYWDLMRRAGERGLRVFDYGRSKRDVGSYRFKKHWGFEPQPLFYEYHLVRATEVPDFNPLNPKYRALAEVWKRLPLGVSKVAGPWISPYLG